VATGQGFSPNSPIFFCSVFKREISGEIPSKIMLFSDIRGAMDSKELSYWFRTPSFQLLNTNIF